ncbi:PREDICTED: uncharacterized protein LOC18611988 isoform X1 [Theobroma cacao]|uniref:Uncharacterized protein LOC18611988 isoform X1 n=1 Tax=Theobroma cacao TaxID=3641 RepID=A0AB32VP64_THECC|nr:PREDICTED: uncharacterized protein LOC18611988 isoform X1 [Theobroma cacao]
MENGHDGKLAEKLSGLALNDKDNKEPSNDDSLFQVMKAVEAAEATIKQQAEENSRLRSELQKKIEQLEQYRVESGSNPNASANGATNSSLNGTLNTLPAAVAASVNNAGAAPSHFSSPSTATSFSPTRYQLEGEYDSRLPQGLMPMPQGNSSNSLWKQDVALKVREHEEEILQLRKQLAEFSVKEAQIRNEKYVLEKRIAYMRLAFDQQQQDLVDAASKALSYRQDIIEENIRLTYQLQAAQQERTTFVSSLLPLLAEYSLHPPVPDAQSIVSNVKVLFKHLQEKLIITESKLKESQYQLAPWRMDVNHSNFAPQSPSHSLGATLRTSSKNALELVPQQAYSQGKTQVTSDAQTDSNWDLPDQHQGGLGGGIASKNLEPDDLGRYSPIASRTSTANEIPTQLAVSRGDMHTMQYGEETINKQVTFRDPVSNSEMDDPDTEGHQIERETPSNWGSGNSPYATTLDDPSSSYPPYLPPVLEEPSSSFSEAAEDDPLPAIEGLQISGEAYPGRELQACGYSINGTTSCNFEWVRHKEDGSVNYIDGAKQPNYLVTADDVDTYLAIEVQPLDNRKRKGELVKVFANEHKKITCDSEMQSHLEKNLYSGHASYKVSFSTGYLDIWEPAMLAIKREGYSIKCGAPNGLVVTEKFSPTTQVKVTFGEPTEFLIIGPNGVQHLLRVDSNSTDISCSRDLIVLTLRLFIIRLLQAGERRKGKKRGLFFNK